MTTIALGNPESAPTFHMPIYALYGKSLRVGIGYRPREVVEIVKAEKSMLVLVGTPLPSDDLP